TASTRLRSRPAGATTESPASGRITLATTAPTCSIPTARTSRPCTTVSRSARLRPWSSAGPSDLVLHPGGSPLLEERAQPLLALAARAPRRRDLGRLDPHRALANESLGFLHRLRPAIEERGDHGVCGALRIHRHLVDEADAERDLGVESFACQEVAPRGRADPPEDERRDHRGDDPQADLGEPEDGGGCGDRDVRAGDEAAPAAEGMPVYPAHHRRTTRVDRLEHPVEAHGVLDVLVVREVDRGALPLDVGSGAEAGAVPCEDDDARVAGVCDGVGQLGDEGRVECVWALGPRGPDG